MMFLTIISTPGIASPTASAPARLSTRRIPLACRSSGWAASTLPPTHKFCVQDRQRQVAFQGSCYLPSVAKPSAAAGQQADEANEVSLIVPITCILSLPPSLPLFLPPYPSLSTKNIWTGDTSATFHMSVASSGSTGAYSSSASCSGSGK